MANLNMATLYWHSCATVRTPIGLALRGRGTRVADFKYAKMFLVPQCKAVATHAALVHEPCAGACDGPRPHTTRGV